MCADPQRDQLTYGPIDLRHRESEDDVAVLLYNPSHFCWLSIDRSGARTDQGRPSASAPAN
jgi:hypothetical protein